MADLGDEPGPPDDPALAHVLTRAQQLGFLGPTPIAEHIAQADRFVHAVGPAGPVRALDLGSGGGVPGLILARRWPSSTWVLLDSMARRTAPLQEAVAELGMDDRVTVCCARAEDAGREEGLRGSFDLVTARLFGPPATTAECGGAFLSAGGRLIVSDPPDGPGERWPAQGLAALGLAVDGHVAGCTVLRLVRPYPADRPRRVGVPAKRPLF